MATSTIPATLAAMVSLFSAELSEVSVHDGPAVAGDYNDHLSIGWDGDNPEVVTFDQNAAGIARGNHPRDEVFVVRCVVSSASGDAVVTTRRDRVFAILAEIEAILRSNIKLGGAVMTAQLADGALLQELSKEDGLAVAVRFGIRCKSRI